MDDGVLKQRLQAGPSKGGQQRQGEAQRGEGVHDDGLADGGFDHPAFLRGQGVADFRCGWAASSDDEGIALLEPGLLEEPLDDVGVGVEEGALEVGSKALVHASVDALGGFGGRGEAQFAVGGLVGKALVVGAQLE